MPRPRRWGLMRAVWSAVRTGLVDMRYNMRRFTLVITCLAVGTALIAGVNSVGASMRQAIERDAAELLGGDLELSRADHPASGKELAVMSSFGQVANVVETNVTATAGRRSAFVDLAAVGAAYPLLGKVTSPQLPPAEKPFGFLSEREGQFGALVDPLMLDELGLKVGDSIEIGGTPFAVRGTLGALPDGAVRGFRLGRLALVTTDGLAALADRTSPLPGLGTWFRYKVLLGAGHAEAGRAAMEKALNDPSWSVRTAQESLGPMAHYFDLFMRFLVIVGLSTLFIGGVSTSTSMSAYVTEQSNTVAIMRSLGSGRSRIFIHFFTQIAALAMIGVALGLVAGGGVAVAALPIVGDAIGVKLTPSLYPQPLLLAAAVGLLTAFAFAYLPLQQAQATRPAILFRSKGLAAPTLDWRRLIGSPQLLPLVIAVAALAWLAVDMAGDPLLVGAFALASIGSAALFRLALAGFSLVAKQFAEAPSRLLRHAVHGISGPGSTASWVVVSVGLVVAMLIVVETLGINLRNEYLGASVFKAPTFVASDLFEDEVATIGAMQSSGADIAGFAAAPMLRGALSAVNGVPADKLSPHGPEAAFLLAGDLPLTYRSAMPSDSRLVAGSWWPTDYHGLPLLSLHQNLRAGLGLNVGDTLTFTVFGDTITARVANFRDYAWQGGIDFLVTFSPGVLEAYPATLLATVTARPGHEDILERQLAVRLPDVRFIAIGKTLERITMALGQLSLAVSLVGAVAVGNGMLTLLGSLAAGRQQRRADAVVAKVLGATPAQVLAVSVLRYGLLAAFAALIATPIGIGLAWVLSSVLLEVEFTVDTVILVAFDIAAVTITGLLGGGSILGALTSRPAPMLRQLEAP